MKRRNFVKSAAGILIPGLITPQLARAVSLVGASGPKLFGYTYPGGGGSFTPAFSRDFDGLADAASVSSSGTVGKRFDFWGTYAGSYGTRASTTDKRPGKTSSARMTIASGDTGRPGDGGSHGDFGGGFNNFGFTVADGGDFWFGFWIKPQSGANFTTNNGLLKFIRLLTQTNASVERGGKLEHHIANNNAAWNFASEEDAKDQDNTIRATDRQLVANSWNWVEIYMRPSFTPANCIRRLWINDQLAYERVGGITNNWHNGSWQQTTSFLYGNTAERLLTASTDTLFGMMFVTYWNGGAPSDQTWYVQSIAAHNNVATLTATDEFGNKMMGSSAI